MTTQLKLYTTADLKNWPDHSELLEGDIILKMSPSGLHAWICDFIRRRLYKLDPEQNLGMMLQEPSVELDKNNAPLPDLAFWVKERRPDINLEVIKVIPDLAVEVWSPHDLDGPKQRKEAMDKIRRYQAAGVKRIWVINPLDKQVTIYIPGQLEALQTLEAADLLEGGDLLPGFSVRVGELFPE